MLVPSLFLIVGVSLKPSCELTTVTSGVTCVPVGAVCATASKGARKYVPVGIDSPSLGNASSRVGAETFVVVSVVAGSVVSVAAFSSVVGSDTVSVGVASVLFVSDAASVVAGSDVDSVVSVAAVSV